MKADSRYFMACVDLCSAKARIERILEWAENGSMPSLDMISSCISDLSSAMVKVARNSLSDPRFKPPLPGCERECGYAAEHHVCQIEGCRI